jgi:hypothetical protein
VQVDPVLAFISASSKEGSIRKLRETLIAWEDKNIDTLHYDIQPSQEAEFQAETGKTDSISVSHSSERLAEIKDQPSPGEITPMAFRHAPPDSLSVSVTQGQNTLTSNSPPVPEQRSTNPRGRMTENDWAPVKETVLQLVSRGATRSHILRVLSKLHFHPT